MVAEGPRGGRIVTSPPPAAGVVAVDDVRRPRPRNGSREDASVPPTAATSTTPIAPRARKRSRGDRRQPPLAVLEEPRGRGQLAVAVGRRRLGR